MSLSSSDDVTERSRPLDLDRLLALRLVVARVGEMDLAKWWHTRAQLGRAGATALRRGFPRTHHFAQARSVFAVAAHRCRQVFDPPGCATLWRLTEQIEEDFDARWERWLEDEVVWRSFFKALEGIQNADLVAALRTMDLLDDGAAASLSIFRRSEIRAVPLPGYFSPTDDCVTQLALGFALGEIGSPFIPYVRIGDR